MVAAEEEALERHFRKLLDQAPPDVVITYGGMLLERSLLVEARSRGIKTVFNLVNASYQESHTFKDVDHIITDSQATADLYRDRLNLQLHVLGPLVDLAPYMVKHHQPRYVTLVNPSLEKGANLVARLALMCQTKLPDLEFLVVESRGRWDDSLQRLGLKGQAFPNVTVWPTQTDMRKVYEQTRILLVPSFGHESGGRVALEAMGNGIPVIAESQGGVKELLAGGGVLLDIPSEVRRHPTTLVDEASAQPWFDMLRSLCSDTFKYASAATRAREAAKKHDIQLPVQRFLSLFPAP